MPANTHTNLKVVLKCFRNLVNGEKVWLVFVRLSIVIDILVGRKVIMEEKTEIVKMRQD